MMNIKNQAHKSLDLNEEHASTRDMNKEVQKSTFAWIDQSNKGIYKVNVKKNTLCSFKTMNIKVLRIFQDGI